MPESETTKHNYLFCQYIDPIQGHDGDRCDCFDTQSQKAKARAIKKLALLHACQRTDQAPTPSTSESAVTSDLAVTITAFKLLSVRSPEMCMRLNIWDDNESDKLFYTDCMR